MASFAADDEQLFPTPGQLFKALPDVLEWPAGKRFARKIVALASPADTPPAGKLGYYSDGAEHVAVAVVSRSGRRLFIEYEPDGVLRTNVAGCIYGDEDF